MRRSLQCFLVVVGLLAVVSAPATAAVLNVPGDYPTITQAMAVAVSGDTVLVAAGTYCESGIVMKDGVVIQGAGAEITTIDGAGTEVEAVVIAPAGVTRSAVLDGFTITGGLGLGGLQIEGSPTITNNTITGNRSVDWGGGGITVIGGSPRIASNIISQNALVLELSGLHPSCAGGLYLEASTSLVQDNWITDNHSASHGGGVCSISSGLGVDASVITGNAIGSNTAAGNGGGLVGWFSAARVGGETEDERNYIQDNVGVQGGGGISLGGWSSWGPGTQEIKGNTITDNRVLDRGDGNGAYGGGIHIFGGIHSITDNWIEGNTSESMGGGIDVTSGPWSETEPDTVITRNIIVRNSAVTGGGARMGASDPTPWIVFTDNEVLENTADWGGGLSVRGKAVVSGNSVAGNSAGWGGGIYTNGGDDTPTIITSNTIKGNRTYGWDNGSGICFELAGSVSVTNNLIVENANDREYRGALTLGAHAVAGITVISGNTIAHNAGGGLSVESFPVEQEYRISNNIIWSNGWADLSVAEGIDVGPYVSSYCDVGIPALPGGVTLGPGDISLDPLFVNAAAGGYHLAALSPCIDTGDPAGDYTGQTDMDGEDRLRGPRVDIGADEALPNAVILSPTIGEVLDQISQPVFTWDAYPEATHYTVSVCPVGEPDVWGPVDVYSTSIQCGVALEGGEYELTVIAHTPAGDAGCRVRFVVYFPQPAIKDVYITRGHTLDVDGAESYFECAQIQVRDMDGWETVSVSTLDPADQTRPGPSDCYGSWGEGAYTHRQGWASWGQTQPLAAGDYTVSAADPDYSDTATATALPIPPVPDLTCPSNGAVIADTVPTFTWGAVPGASYICLCLEEAGHNTPVVWARGDIPGDAVSITYGDGGSARDAALAPGSRYRLRLMPAFADDDRVRDPRFALWSWSERVVEFWVAPEPPLVPVQGTMMISNCFPGPFTVSFLTGDRTGLTPGPAGIRPEGDLSPDGQWIVYQEFNSARACRPDGSDDHLIIQMDGDVCGLRWSPDGRRVAFNSPTADDPTPPGCAGAGEVHVVNADGTGLTRVSYHIGPDTVSGWSPDGTRLLWDQREQGVYGIRGMVGSVDGSEVHQITGPGRPVDHSDLEWAPDGARIGVVWPRWENDELVGTLGTIAPDGTDLQALFTWTVPPQATNDWWFAPARMRWSPDGSQLAFTAGFHLLSEGDGDHGDAEIYLLNADGSGLTRLTYDFSTKNYVSSWRGPNTVAGANQTTTICNTTITFAEVAEPGLTTATVYAEPPPGSTTPSGFQFLGDYYSIATTAQLAQDSKISIQIHYSDADVPDGNEEALSLLHWDGSQWVDITTNIDTANNIMTGECYSLSDFTISHGPKLVGLLPPVNNDGSSIFKLNSTVPVKFQLLAPDGSWVSDATARLERAKVSSQIVGTYEAAASTSQADTGNTFRYDPDADQYIFNLGTKGLTTGTWALKVTVNGLVMKVVWISLR